MADNDLKTLVLVPRGNVTISKDYGIRTVGFENGVTQYQRKYISPTITYSFATEGNVEMKKYLEDFIDSVCGSLIPFYWEYDGETIPCRFSDGNIEYTAIRGYEGQGVVGYRINVTLRRVRDSEL